MQAPEPYAGPGAPARVLNSPEPVPMNGVNEL
jgi:hypothetical protein